MGCVSAKDAAALANFDYGKAYEKYKKQMESKYTEESQKSCEKYESQAGLRNLDFKVFIGAVEASDDVAAIIEKANLKSDADKAESKVKDILGVLIKPSPKEARILAGLMMCKGDIKEKGERLFSVMAKAEKAEEVDYEKVKAVLIDAMTIAIKVIPKQAGSGADKDYTVEPKDYVRNWFREASSGKVKKEKIVKWVSDGIFSAAEARDQALRTLIVELPKRESSDTDREVQSTSAGLMDKAKEAAGAGKKAVKKKYRDRRQVQSKYFEEDLGLDAIPFAKLYDAAEYYKPGEKGAYNDESMLKVFDKAGQKDVYVDKKTRIKEFLQEVVKQHENPYLAIQMFALLFCPGTLAEKFDTFYSFINQRDGMKHVCKGKNLYDTLMLAMNLSAHVLLKVMKYDNHEFETVDVHHAAKLWWSGKDEDPPKEIKYEDLKKWAVEDAKFESREARQVIITEIEKKKK